MIGALKNLVLSKLHEFLYSFGVCALARGPVIEFLRYAYNNDDIMDREDDLYIDPLRKLALEFIYMHDEAFRNFPGHQEAVKMEGEYAVDLINLMRASVDAETVEVLRERLARLTNE
jgi:hypothetical protein